MTDELKPMTQMPTLQSLDEAAQAIEFRDWNHGRRFGDRTANSSIIAHARTLDTLRKREHVEDSHD